MKKHKPFCVTLETKVFGLDFVTRNSTMLLVLFIGGAQDNRFVGRTPQTSTSVYESCHPTNELHSPEALERAAE